MCGFKADILLIGVAGKAAWSRDADDDRDLLTKRTDKFFSAFTLIGTIAAAFGSSVLFGVTQFALCIGARVEKRILLPLEPVLAVIAKGSSAIR